LSGLNQHHLPTKTISFTIAGGLLIYLAMTLAWTEWNVMLDLVQDMPTSVWLQLGLLAFFSYAMRFARWHLMISRLGHHVPLGYHLLIYLSAFALAFTPAKIGETIRSFYLHPLGVSYPTSLSAFVVERLIDLLVVGALSSLVFFLFTEHAAWLITVWVVALTATALFRSKLLTWMTARWLKGVAVGYVTEAVTASSQMLSRHSLFKVVPLTFIAWTSQSMGLFLVASAMGHELSLQLAIAIYSLSLLAGAASFIPGGLGATEATMLLLLMAAGQDLTTATTAALVSRGVPLWLAMGLGTLSMLRLTSIQKEP